MFNQPQNCVKLFSTWKPILEALERHHTTNIRKFNGFMYAMYELIMASIPMFDSNRRYSKEPIAYGFLAGWNINCFSPVCNPDVVFVPVVHRIFGPILQVIAAKALKAGDLVN